MSSSPRLSETNDRSFLVPVIVTTGHLAVVLIAWTALTAMRFLYTRVYGELNYKDRRSLGRQEKLAHSIENPELRLDVERAIHQCRTVAKLRHRVSSTFICL